MKMITSKDELRRAVLHIKKEGRTIGLVPTMGFLHDGHLSLIQRARKENDFVVVSVFVNPKRFAPNEDLESYPRDRIRDNQLMQNADVDIAFCPSTETMYPKGHTTYVEVEGPMIHVLCGRSRPTHFKGVTTVVAKLFNMVSPDRAYFGQKDAQQVIVVKQMVNDLDFDVQIVVCPIVRENDGLAMSSRNAYLTQEERSEAPTLYRSLCNAKKLIANGERSAMAIKQHIESQVNLIEDATIDYVDVVNAHTLEEIERVDGSILIAMAVKFGTTRLIDNLRIDL